MNYAEFFGSEDSINKLYEEFSTAADKEKTTGMGQSPFFDQPLESYSFFIFVHDRAKDCLKVDFSSRWSPNLSDVARWCSFLSVRCRVVYEEPGMFIYGYADIDEKGNITDRLVDGKWLDKVSYNENEWGDSQYEYEGKQYESMSDLINKKYYGENIL